MTEHPLFWSLANTPFEREFAYRELLEQGLTDSQVQALTASVLKGAPMASAVYMRELVKEGHQFLKPKLRGRPPKEKIDSDPS